MRWRTSISASLLVVLLTSLLVMGAPEFKMQESESLTLNPLDNNIFVYRASVGKVAAPIRIKELTVKNFGTASENELEEIQLRYRSESGSLESVTLDELAGIDTGITFTLPGDGVPLEPGENSLFQLAVSAAEPENIPVSKYGQGVSLKLGTMFHYVFQEDDGEAVDSVSSNWVIDSGPDGITRGGFEEREVLELDREVLQPGITATIGRYVFRDVDANKAGVEVKNITVQNHSVKEKALVLGEDISQIQLNLRIEEDGVVTEKSITKEISAPISEVSIPTEEGGWWDGRCSDGCRLEIEVVGKLKPDGPTPGKELKTGVELATKEDNGMAGFPFSQRAVVPDSGKQVLIALGLKEIEDITDWESGVVNQGEKYKQRLTLSDEDLDRDDFIVKSIKLRNDGSVRSDRIKDVSIYRVKSDGSLIELGTDLDLSGSWQPIDSERGGKIPDDGRGVFEIHYWISSSAKEGTTLQPVVRFRGTEGQVDKLLSPELKTEKPLTIYPWGSEKVETSRDYGGFSADPDGGAAILAQRLDLMDKDQNHLDLFTNPVVIKNMGEATGSDFIKLELYDSNGNLLAEETDLSGLTTAGITLDNLNGKTTISDDQAGNWRSFFIFLTPRSPISRKTVNLKTILYQTEGERDVIRTAQGPKFEIGTRGYESGQTTVQKEETREGTVLEGIEENAGLAIAAVAGIVILYVVLSGQMYS